MASRAIDFRSSPPSQQRATVRGRCWLATEVQVGHDAILHTMQCPKGQGAPSKNGVVEMWLQVVSCERMPRLRSPHFLLVNKWGYASQQPTALAYDSDHGAERMVKASAVNQETKQPPRALPRSTRQCPAAGHAQIMLLQLNPYLVSSRQPGETHQIHIQSSCRESMNR